MLDKVFSPYQTLLNYFTFQMYYMLKVVDPPSQIIFIKSKKFLNLLPSHHFSEIRFVRQGGVKSYSASAHRKFIISQKFLSKKCKQTDHLFDLTNVPLSVSLELEWSRYPWFWFTISNLCKLSWWDDITDLPFLVFFNSNKLRYKRK